jgi:hypothetical protein
MNRFDQVDNRLGSVDASLGVVERRLGAVETRMDSLETQMRDLRNDTLSHFDGLYPHAPSSSKSASVSQVSPAASTSSKPTSEAPLPLV